MTDLHTRSPDLREMNEFVIIKTDTKLRDHHE